MNLGHLRLLKEDEGAWHVHDTRKNERFPVAKKGLSPGVHKMIAQHFADGGEVDATGPGSLPPGIERNTVGYDAGTAPTTPWTPGGAGDVRPGHIEDEPVAILRNASDIAAHPRKSSSFGQDLVDATKAALSPSAIAHDAAPYARGVLDLAQTVAGGTGAALDAGGVREGQAQTNEARSLVSGAVGPDGLPVSPAAPEAPGVPVAQQGPAAQPPGTGGSGMPSGYDRAIKEAGKAEGESIGKRADIASHIADEQLKLQQAYQAKAQETHAYWEGLAKKNLADIDKTQKELASGSIDPHHWWNTRSVGQQIGTTIGMILGGIGQAFGGGPNQTLQLVHKAIDRDLEAQKANLGKKQSLLSSYVSQGHSIEQAENMVRNHDLAAFSGQMEMVSTKYGGPQAQAIAQGLKAEVGKKVYEDTLKAHQLGSQVALQGLQVQATKQNMALQAQQMKLLGQTLGGGQVDPRAIALLPKEVRETLVNMPDGSYATAKTPKDAETVRTSQEATNVLSKKLQRYGELLRNNKHGIFEAADPAAYQEAQSLRASMLTDLNGLAGLNRFTHEEAQIFQNRIPDITKAKFRSSGDIAGVQELAKEIQEKVGATNKSLLNLPSRKGATSQERYP